VEWWKNNNQTHLSKCMNKLLNVLSSSCHVHLLAFSSDLFPQTLKSETVCTCCCFPPSNKYLLNLFLSLCVHFPSFQDTLFLFCIKHETKTLPQTLTKTLKKQKQKRKPSTNPKKTNHNQTPTEAKKDKNVLYKTVVSSQNHSSQSPQTSLQNLGDAESFLRQQKTGQRRKRSRRCIRPTYPRKKNSDVFWFLPQDLQKSREDKIQIPRQEEEEERRKGCKKENPSSSLLSSDSSSSCLFW
jgi:hypothetical protein